LDYSPLVASIPTEKRDTVSDKLIDLILTTKNEEKMPAQLANNILHQWQRDMLKNEQGLTALLQAAMLLEPEKTFAAFNELQMTSIAEQMQKLSKT